MHLFLAPECLPFAIATVMLAALTCLEVAGLLLGFSLGDVIDKAWPSDHDGISGLMSWLNVGGVPILILFMLLLGLFAMGGFVLQAVAYAVWMPLPALVASIPAAVLALPATRLSSRQVARIVPRDETYAVDLSEFIGRGGQVTVGPLDQGLPGRVRIKDQHGNWHVLRAKAAPNEAPIPIGAQILIVDCVSNIFIAIPAPSDMLTQPVS
ncbi:YqiJ family protein [Neorhizobium sp. BETTINA12A]|uniref:OB-fold-containig protein n=1 Tax=Neorhizobium sp. BETTINA12A TaxID=2908924 RepID=UPI001FF55A8E|nr:OB-fold-containig protein [Neorhizobium sp. BETTINA12A]MCJ9751201.1 YqiJ family protein [Neorhizobium sp. BETTINA12A]